MFFFPAVRKTSPTVTLKPGYMTIFGGVYSLSLQTHIHMEFEVGFFFFYECVKIIFKGSCEYSAFFGWAYGFSAAARC